MPEKKKAHYVPKFYLKRFSNDRIGKSIGIYNIPSETFIREGSLKNQAYKSYFYGKKEIEDAFGALEDKASLSISNIVDNNKPLVIGSTEHGVIINFVVLLRYRTLSAAEEQDELLDKTIKIIFGHDSRLSPHINKFKAKYNNPALAALHYVGISLPLAYDLGAILLTNYSGLSLITSDNPVIFYNQFIENKWIKRFSGTGLAAKGLQIFLPLDSSHLLLFYDRDVYKIGSARKRIVGFSSIRDTNWLNRLQILNSKENVYFDSSTKEGDIRKLAMSNGRSRSSRKANVEEYFQGKDAEGLSHSIIHASKKDMRINLELSFIKLLKKARKYEFGNSVFHVRNPELVSMHDDFMELVKEGKYVPADFKKYLLTKIGI